MMARRLNCVLILVGTIWLLRNSAAYFLPSENYGFPHSREFYLANWFVVRTHIVGGMIALVTGPLLFVRFSTRTFRKFHFTIGAIHVFAICLVAVPTAILLNPAIPGGFLSRFAFFALAFAWFCTTLMTAVSSSNHRLWAIRSYAITLSAITFRVIVAVLDAVGMSFEAAYLTASWLWLVNLFIAEKVINDHVVGPDPKS